MQKSSNLTAFQQTLTTSVIPTSKIVGSFVVRGSVASQVSQVVYLGARQVSISVSEYDTLQQKAAEYDTLTAKIELLEVENQELRTSTKIINTPSDNNFLADNSWIHVLTTREQKLLEPKAMEAVGKLLRLKGQVIYSIERGPRAQGPNGWIEKTLLEPYGPLTKDELEIIPQWVYLRFDKKLYQALQDAKQREKKKSTSK